MELKQVAASGVKWTTLSTAIVIGLQFVQLAVLAHILEPSDFGMMAMIMVIIRFLQAYVDMGISNAIIYRQDANRNELSSLYWLTLFTGFVVCAIVLLITPLVADFFGEQRLAELIPWMALTFLIIPVGQQFRILLRRDLWFGLLAKIDVVGAIVGTYVAIQSVLLGQGIFSLIWGQLAMVSATTLLLTIQGLRTWKPKFRFSVSDIKDYIGFGLYQMGERSLNCLGANADYIIIGRFLGSEILGIYTLAYQLVVMPLVRINPILNRVAFPVFAKKQSDNFALQRGYLALIKLLSISIFPLLIILGVSAPLLIPVAFGEQWLAAVPLVQILVPLGMLKSLTNPSGSVFLAKGRADIGFKWNGAITVATFLVFWIVVQYGVNAVALSYVLLCIISFPIVVMILRSIIGLDWRQYFSTLYRPASVAVVMGISMLAAATLLDGFKIGEIPQLFVTILTGIIIYGLMLYAFEREYIADMWQLLITRKGGP